MTFDFSYHAIILAAGDSGRMGVPKLSLMFREGASFVERCVSQFLLFGCSKVVVVVNPGGLHWIEQRQPHFPGMMMVVDGHNTFWIKQVFPHHPGRVVLVINRQPEHGRCYSLQQGLKHTGKDCAVFIHNVDNPFVSTTALGAMDRAARQPQGFAWISPRYEGKGGHPILLSAGLANKIRQEPATNIQLKEYLSHEKRTDAIVDDPAILININTMKEYRDAGLTGH